jgi:hypothetical protein
MDSLDERLKRASRELTRAREAEDEVLTCYWFNELDRCLDELSEQTARVHA